MIVPNFESLARSVFNLYPADIAALRQVCDETDALRARAPGDPGVAAGETRANNLKGLFTRRIAWACHQHDIRFGLRRKTAGQLATRPSDGLTHSTDALMWRDTGNIVDVMSDRNVSWLQNDADTQPLDQWVEPLPEGEGAPSLPVDPTLPPPATDAELKARVQSLESTVNLQAQMLREQTSRISQLADRVRILEEKPAPEVLIQPALELPALVADGLVSLGWGLQKRLTLPVRLARGGDPK